MTKNTPLREAFIGILKDSGYNDEVAEVLINRIHDRLGGYTHEEVVKMHPMPEDQK